MKHFKIYFYHNSKTHPNSIRMYKKLLGIRLNSKNGFREKLRIGWNFVKCINQWEDTNRKRRFYEDLELSGSQKESIKMEKEE